MKLLLNTFIVATLITVILSWIVGLMLLCKYYPLIGVITLLMIFSLCLVHILDIRFIK